MEITLEALGFTKKQLQEKVIEKAAQDLLSGVTYDEDGNVEEVDSKLRIELSKKIKEGIDETVNIFAEKNVLPNVNKLIETMIFQETTTWGEKKGSPMSFIQYLQQRAEVYMSEEVDSSGKSERECRSRGNSWYGGKQSRISYMISMYLSDKISEAMKDSLSIANKAIAQGIEATVRIKLKEITDSITCAVNIKK